MAPQRRDVPLLDDPRRLTRAYESSKSIAALAERIGVSATTVQRALKRHGIRALPRNRNRRPATANILDDAAWLRSQYRARSGVDIAAELGASSRTVYAAMDRHGIPRRTEPGASKLRRPQLTDSDWLHAAVERASSTQVAKELGVSAGTVTTAYVRAGLDPSTTPRLYERGRARTRPTPDELCAAWDAEGSFRGVGRHLGVSHNTAAVWLAEVDVFADSTPALSRSRLVDAITRRLPITRIAADNRVSATTVLVELHRHGLFEAHRTRHRS